MLIIVVKERWRGRVGNAQAYETISQEAPGLRPESATLSTSYALNPTEDLLKVGPYALEKSQWNRL